MLYRILGLMILVLLLACGGKEVPPQNMKSPDLSMEMDVVHDIEPDMPIVDMDMAQELDLDVSPDVPPEDMPALMPTGPDVAIEASQWATPVTPCDTLGEARPPSPMGERPMVTRQAVTGPQTLNDLDRQYGPNYISPNGIRYLVTRNREQSVPRGPAHINALPGESVSLYFHQIWGTETWTPEQFRGLVTVMLDYKPVPFDLVQRQRLGLEPVQTWEQITGTRVEFQDRFTYFNITLRPELFPEQRTYELAITIREDQTTSFTRRYEVHNGDFGRPPTPCHSPPLDARYNDFEERSFRIGHSPSVLLFPEDTPNPVRWIHAQHYPRQVAPGQTIKLLASLYRSDGHKTRNTPIVLVPTLNGAPIDEPYFLSKGPNPNVNLRIDARFSYELKIPEEPGIYEFVMMSWSDPFKPYTDKDANYLDVSSGGTFGAHSNSLIFEVPPP